MFHNIYYCFRKVYKPGVGNFPIAMFSRFDFQRFNFFCYVIFSAREPPILEIFPAEPQNVHVGEQAMLSCRAIAGIPSPTLTWVRRDRRPLSSHITEEYAGTIIFKDITLDEAGEYECTAENIAGKVSASATVNVQQSPLVSIKPESTELTLTEGDELKLECSAQGLPQPNVEWREPGVEHSVRAQAPPRFSQSYAVVQKYNVRQSDEGTYVCRATNEAGTEEKYIYVQIQQKRGDVGEFAIVFRII